ncbi:hypothetical protein BDV25DRAFT_136655 [Aspergillus avenaceus]|uniref:Uncharacterized protein n=1 Tax=Aspergillus avenaceus TaxID=36643 RepID=A0A5N6U546_ASPAV|nr:hypothetical protein BDV25DRAFT_136655 [Aspergillus avenaceus]
MGQGTQPRLNWSPTSRELENRTSRAGTRHRSRAPTSPPLQHARPGADVVKTQDHQDSRLVLLRPPPSLFPEAWLIIVDVEAVEATLRCLFIPGPGSGGGAGEAVGAVVAVMAGMGASEAGAVEADREGAEIEGGGTAGEAVAEDLGAAVIAAVATGEDREGVGADEGEAIEVGADEAGAGGEGAPFPMTGLWSSGN